MTIPNLKRIKFTSPEELTVWFAKNHDQAERVMLVTHAEPSHTKHVSHEMVEETLSYHGYRTERRYTLNPTLIGHVVSKHPDAQVANRR